MFQIVYIVPVVTDFLVFLSLVQVCIFSCCCYILPGGFKHLFQFVYLVPVVIYYLVVLNICSSLYIYFLCLYITWWFETFVPVCLFSSCCYILPGCFKHLFQFVYLVPVVICYLVILNISSSLYI